MDAYSLCFFKNTSGRKTGNMTLFQEKAEAQVIMRASYDEVLEQLAFDTDVYDTDHFCGCGSSSAVIIDGETKYSWSISEKEMPLLSEIPSLAEILVYRGSKKADGAKPDISGLSGGGSPQNNSHDK